MIRRRSDPPGRPPRWPSTPGSPALQGAASCGVSRHSTPRAESPHDSLPAAPPAPRDSGRRRDWPRACLLALILGHALSGLARSDGLLQTAPTIVVRQVNEDGFGDSTNKYAWSMATFKDKLYVATLNADISRPAEILLFFFGLPFSTNGTQIWRGDFSEEGEWVWDKVLEQADGNRNHYGVRKMIVVGEFLYGVTGNHVEGLEVWRTRDGEHWQVVAHNGFSNPNNTSGRGLASFQGYLYVGVENRLEGAQIWRRKLKANGDFAPASSWQPAAASGIVDAGNFWFSDFVVHGNYLYTGTLNIKGMQLWRTNGRVFEKIFENGYDDLFNTAAMKLYVYRGRLYVGTMNLVNGFRLYASKEKLDSYATADIPFARVLVNDDPKRRGAYLWYLEEFNGRLYAGTFTTFQFFNGSFKLFSSADGEHDWVVETDNAFGHERQYGLRSMEVFKGKLMIGTATAQPEKSCKILEATPKR